MTKLLKKLAIISSCSLSTAVLAQPLALVCSMEAEGDAVSSSFLNREVVTYRMDAIFEESPQAKLDASVYFGLYQDILWDDIDVDYSGNDEKGYRIYKGIDNAGYDLTFKVNMNTKEAYLKHRDLELSTVCK